LRADRHHAPIGAATGGGVPRRGSFAVDSFGLGGGGDRLVGDPEDDIPALESVAHGDAVTIEIHDLPVRIHHHAEHRAQDAA
jgi:hypothetical protein